jgi:hypothetical protein
MGFKTSSKPVLAVLAVAALLTGTAAARTSTTLPPAAIGTCTMALPALHATVEAEITDAPDFCELVSEALGADVFRAPLIVTPGRLWHYAGARLSCDLGYGETGERMTIRNSPPACDWLVGLTSAWHREPSASLVET